MGGSKRRRKTKNQDLSLEQCNVVYNPTKSLHSPSTLAALAAVGATLFFFFIPFH